MSDSMQHPAALSTGEKIWEGVKHIGKKALKWGAFVALAGGVVGAAVAFGPAAFTALFSTGGGIALETAAITKGLMFGGAIGALLGAAKSVGDLPEAIQQAEDRKIANYERGEARQMKVAMMQQQLGASQGAVAGVSPSLLQGRGQDGPGMGRA